MKKVKLVFWLLILILLGLLVYQNQGYFFSKHSLGLNLYFSNRVTPDVYNLVIIAVAFAAGLLMAYLSSLFERFKANKTIKELKSVNKTHQETVDQMRGEVEEMKKTRVQPNALEGSQTGDISGMSENTNSESRETETTAQPPQS